MFSADPNGAGLGLLAVKRVARPMASPLATALGTDSFERPGFYFSSECVLVNDGFEREGMIGLWKIATWPADNSAPAVDFSRRYLNRGACELVSK